MEYTIKQLAKLAGVSSRTLRYYDEIDLLKPARINSSGYRIYGQKEVDLLQQILFYRELDVRLDKIKMIIQDPNFDEQKALHEHLNQLEKRKERLEHIITTVEETIASIAGGKRMEDKQKFEGFKKKVIVENEEKYGEEIRDKYGDETVDASNVKLMGMSETDYNEWTALGEEIMDLLKKAKATNDPDSKESRELGAKHKQWLLYTWSNYTEEAHANLAEMYVADDRFTKYYDKEVNGGVVFLRDAVLSYLGQSGE